MKKNIFLVALVLFTAVLFNAPSVKAENTDKTWSKTENYTPDGYGSNSMNNTHNNGPGNNGSHNAGNGPAISNTALPINNGVVFLFVAGMAIGIVTLKKFKSLTPAMAAK